MEFRICCNCLRRRERERERELSSALADLRKSLSLSLFFSDTLIVIASYVCVNPKLLRLTSS